jgi:hypothetical protein
MIIRTTSRIRGHAAIDELEPVLSTASATLELKAITIVLNKIEMPVFVIIIFSCFIC